jgi:hypothetical protein
MRGIRFFAHFTLLLVCLVGASSAGAAGGQAKKGANGRACYDSSIFDNLSASKQKYLKEYAPVAVYMQEQTGYPASVMISHMIKERGWVFGNRSHFFGISCMSGNRATSHTFQAPSGVALPVHRQSCAGSSWQKYSSAKDAVADYVELVTTDSRYHQIQSALPSIFPPPADERSMIRGIGNSPYCNSGCHCDIGSYSACMVSNIVHNHLAALDEMTICDFGMRQIRGLPAIGSKKVSRPTSTTSQGGER